MTSSRKLCGALITNAFLRTDKFVEHYDWLQRAAKKQGMQLDLWENADILPAYGMAEPFLMRRGANPAQEEDVCGGSRFDHIEQFLDDYSFVIFWDKDVRLASRLQEECRMRNIPMFNTPEGIARCDDKSETYRILQGTAGTKGFPFLLIPTIIAPMSYSGIAYGEAKFVAEVIRTLSLPLVIKECFGSFGQQVYLAETAEDVMAYTKRLAGTPFLYQKYIRASHGVDIRLQVVGETVVAAMKRRTRSGDFRANLTNGGTMERYEPSAAEKEIAVEATKVLGLAFAGVDLLFAEGEEKPATMLCEVNSQAHFRNIADCTGVNTADCIMAYIGECIGKGHN